MKSIQRIILWTGYVALGLIANPVHLQAQTDYTNGNLIINTFNKEPSNVAAITRIDGTLNIGGALTSFPNFAALEVVEGDIIIEGITTNALITLDNIFPVLDTIRGDLVIDNNDFIQTITGFVALDSVGGSLIIGIYIYSTSSEGILNIPDNAQLTSIPSFSSLQTIGEGLSILNNALLPTVSGFEALQTIGFSLNINVNPELTSIPSFSSLQTIGDDININDNPKLTNCCGIRPFIRTALLQRNGTGCNSVDEIETNCAPPAPPTTTSTTSSTSSTSS